MIKLVAVDMDGTFLKSDMTYDSERFRKIYEKMKLAGVQFVVASGNQYYQLKSFFPMDEELCFVAENGGFVKACNDLLFVGDIPGEQVRQVLDVLAKDVGVEVILCGKESAYTASRSEKFVETGRKYYHRLKVMDNLDTLPEDTFIKFALSIGTDEVEHTMNRLKEVLGEKIVPVSSGHRDIDLIVKGVNKAYGLSILGKKLGISAEEMIAFGDSGNDKEMLEYVGFGFAMENAQPAIKSLATKIIPENNEQGVLQTLEDFASNNWEYPY